MKRILLFIPIVLLCLSLFSCFGKNKGDEIDDGKVTENLIYDSSTTLYLVYDPAELPEELAVDIMDAFSYAGILVQQRSRDSQPGEHELVIGNMGRAVSDEAYIQLDRIDKNTERDLRFCVYSSGASVALAYDNDDGYYCLSAAVEYFIDNYVKDSLILEKGVAYKTAFDLYEHLDGLDEAYYAEAWNKVASLGGQYGEDLVNSLKSYYSLYDGEKLVKWVANLYDSNICVCYGLYGETECKKGTDNAPEYCKFCGTGGFYFSNSGRDNYGYLPDAESTYQALAFLVGSGVGKSYGEFIPEWMGKQISDFIYNLQDPDGYFYHPQWGKDITVSRRSRDASWCKSILSSYGVATKYDTYSDISAASAYLPARLGSSAVGAVSKVVMAEGETLIPSHLQSLDAFRDYLVSLDFANNSYSAGNTVSAQGGEIIARGKDYCDLLINFLNEMQYDNGTWHHTVDYYAINGVMKICGIYNGMEAEIPRAALACKAAFAAISSDEETEGIVDTWNAWSVVIRIIENINSYAQGGAETAASLRNEILASASSAILTSRDKLSAYLKDDGSFSYFKDHSSTVSQGAAVAIPGTNEGDLNATVIGSVYMVETVFLCLGMSEYEVPICNEKERVVFSSIINDLSPVNKGDTGVGSERPIEFDYDGVGDAPDEVEVGQGSEAVVIADGRGKGNVLKYTSSVNPGPYNDYSSNYLKLINQGTKMNVMSQVFEGEFCFLEKLPRDDAFRIEMGCEGDVQNCYRITFRQSGDDIQLYESSANVPSLSVANSLGVSAKVGEWFKIRAEYYKGDDRTVRIKVYFNDKLCAVSDNYYDAGGAKLSGEGVPSDELRHTRIYALSGSRVCLLMDNLLSYASRSGYVKEMLHEDYRNNPYAINVDDIYENTIVYGFDGQTEKNTERLTVNPSTGIAEIRSDGSGKYLALSNGGCLYVPVVRLSGNDNCSVFSMKISAKDAELGDIAKISLAEGNGTNKSLIDLVLTVADENGERFLRLKDMGGNILPGVNIPIEEAATLRIDLYDRERVALFYVDGKPKGLTSELSAEGRNLTYAKAIVTALSESVIALDDLSADRCNKDYSAATEPPYDGKTYGFDTGLDGLTFTGKGISVTGSGEGAKLKFEFNSSDKGTLKIPATNRDDILSMTEFAFDIAYADASMNGAAHNLAITDKDGRTIISFAVCIKDGVAEIHESTSLGMHKAPILSFNAKNGARLGFEFYEVDKVCKIYLDNAYVALTPLVYSAENARQTPSFATVSAASIRSVAVLDNIVLDRVNKLYKEETSEKPESDAEIITFEYGSGNSFSEKLSYAMSSAAPTPSVVEIEKNQAPNKALKFETSVSSGMDFVSINYTAQASGAVSYVFETDMIYNSSSVFELWTVSAAGLGIQIHMFGSGGEVFAYHGRHSEKINLGVKVGEWFGLRVEYYFAEGKNYAKVHVNGELAYTAVYYYGNGGLVGETYIDGELYDTDIMTNNEVLISSVTRIDFKAPSYSSGTVYLDNISFRGSSQKYE